MSTRYKGSIMSSTAATTTSLAALGIWRSNEVMQAQSAVNWPTDPTLADTYFKYNSLLLPGNGTNNANNNTFLDSSTNALTVTRAGNTTQGTFSPYGANWSNYFDGTGDYLSLSSNSAFDLGTGAYTVEAWVYLTSYATNEAVMFCNGNASGGIGCSINTGGQIYISKYNFGQVITGSAGDVPLNQWNHLAYVRSSTASNGTRLYVNGVLKATGTDSNNWNVTTTPTVGALTISGFGIIGNISNVRIVKGTAVYTDTFTPPTTPLTAISGTSLLTCQSNRFVDNSTNAFVVTKYGDTSVQRFSPFSPSSPGYTSAVYGGSGYFDGTGDYLGVAYSANLTMPADFTAECWVYVTSAPNSHAGILAFSNDSEGVGWNILIGGNTSKFHFNVAMTFTDTATSMTLNAWTHLALVRSGSTVKLYINGVADANTVTTSATATCPTNPQIGSYPLMSSRPFFGYISNARVVKGTAVYTANFTPPTTPPTAITNTQLLLNCTNAGIIDNAMLNNLETVGDVKISTAVNKFGGSSMLFSGSSGSNPTTRVRGYSPVYNLNTANFTVEMWYYPTAHNSTGYPVLYSSYETWVSGSVYNGQIALLAGNQNYAVGSKNKVYLTLGDNYWYGTTTVPPLNTWTHIALVRNVNRFMIFINGTMEVDTTQAVSTITNNQLAVVGGGIDAAGLNCITGYIDDLRITKGYARYTANFTPPTSTFPIF